VQSKREAGRARLLSRNRWVIVAKSTRSQKAAEPQTTAVETASIGQIGFVLRFSSGNREDVSE
jgi:hypothetical protein